jgi:glycosyltransferase involved in cell wall biosynthesis
VLVVVVMPAYNAEKTLEKTFHDLPSSLQSNVILVDDASTDSTVKIAQKLGMTVIQHQSNLGYGGNQKTCYRTALAAGADIVVMLHPDYQYDARVCKIMAELIQLGNCDIVLGSRIRTRSEALEGGMPKWKYFLNRISTFSENLVLGQSVGDFHTGMRAYSRDVLEKIPFELNSNDFGFDQEFLIQAINLNFKLGDIPVPVRYFKEASSINLRRSMSYGLVTVWTILKLFCHKIGIKKYLMFLPTTSHKISK